MPRIVSVWLPRWPILRFLLTQARRPSAAPVDPTRPFVLAAATTGSPRVAAFNAAAEAEGLRMGDTLADARAKAGMLQVRPAEPAADADALRRLALWATRYTPTVAPWGEAGNGEGFFLDIAGAAHLFGGEAMLRADLSARLNAFGLPPRIAIADTPGAAWAMSRFSRAAPVDVPSGKEGEALAPLPIEALRLSQETCTTLRRLGFKRVGALIDKPRAPFAARFERELLKRLDQALGRAGEPLAPLAPPPVYHSLRCLLEPIATQDAIVTVATCLMQDLVHKLVGDGVGARALRLSLYRVDGAVRTLDIALTLPTRSPAHVAYLIALKLDRIVDTIESGFGFETLSLAVTAAESFEARQKELAPASRAAEGAEQGAALIDALRQRLGPQSVRRIAPVASHLPERSEAARAAAGEAHAWPARDGTRRRPALLLPRAEPADVVALVPEGPPQQFRWRGKVHGVARAEGPERIAGEWWRYRQPQPTRDYYLVEDSAGRRFWLYREGLYERETMKPRWFVHGLFA